MYLPLNYDRTDNFLFDEELIDEAHRKGKRKSTQEKHQAGERKVAMSRGGEKGDTNRLYPRKRPKNWKGPWPPVKKESDDFMWIDELSHFDEDALDWAARPNSPWPKLLNQTIAALRDAFKALGSPLNVRRFRNRLYQAKNLLVQAAREISKVMSGSRLLKVISKLRDAMNNIRAASKVGSQLDANRSVESKKFVRGAIVDILLARRAVGLRLVGSNTSKFSNFDDYADDDASFDRGLDGDRLDELAPTSKTLYRSKIKSLYWNLTSKTFKVAKGGKVKIKLKLKHRWPDSCKQPTTKVKVKLVREVDWWFDDSYKTCVYTAVSPSRAAWEECVWTVPSGVYYIEFKAPGNCTIEGDLQVVAA